MSYNTSLGGPGGHGYSYDDHEIPAYHEQGSSRHQKPARPQRPSQQQQFQQHQQHQQYQSDPRMRFPRPQANTRVQPAQPMEPPRNMYDGSDYGYDEPELDQWPLSSQVAPSPRQQPSPQRSSPAAARSGPPPRPQRPDYVPDNFQAPRQPARAVPANQMYQQQPMQQQQQYQQQQYQQPLSPHGTGQWTGDGYSYATPSSASPGNPVVQHASYNKNVPARPPLGPPPSSRRGPSSYYSQQLGPVQPIEEEAERASMLKELTEGETAAWGNLSRTSLNSSNAIPIGISKSYLNGRASGVSMTPSESVYSDADADEMPVRKDEPLRPFQQRMQEHEPEPEPEPINNTRDALPSQQHRANKSRGIYGQFPPPAPPSVTSSYRDESPSEANIPVRHASMGKRSKPTLTHVKSGDRIKKRASDANEAIAQEKIAGNLAMLDISRKQPEKQVESGAEMTLDESPVEPHMPLPAAQQSYFDSASTSLKTQTRTPSDSPEPVVRKANSKELLAKPKPTLQTRGRSPLSETNNDSYGPHLKEMLVDTERGELHRKDSDTLKSPTAGYLDQRVGRKRPARLDVDVIRDQEARGSLSSLTDLIKRATRVASNLDRGKTASRLGMEGWLKDSNGKTHSSDESEKYRRSAGSLSDILASFPPPGIPTPTGNSLANWSSRRDSRPLPSDSDSGSHAARKPKRRCCGLPPWLFITLLILLVLLIAAAVLVPVFLVVLPNQNNDASSSSNVSTGSQASLLSKCAAKLTCENGGQAFPVSDSTSNKDTTCRCLCVDSFTGSTCSQTSTAGCSSLAISGLSQNATVGNAIPRLLDLAPSTYDLALDAATLIGLFNEADLSCASENALVSFDGKSQKKMRKRQDASQTTTAESAEATANGIVFDSTASASSATATATPTAMSSSSSATATTTSTASSTATADVDFARAAVLYILQNSSSLSQAESAQKALQESLSADEGGVVVDAGGRWRVDLGQGKVSQE